MLQTSQNFIKQVISDILKVPFAKPTSANFLSNGSDQYLQHWLEMACGMGITSTSGGGLVELGEKQK